MKLYAILRMHASSLSPAENGTQIYSDRHHRPKGPKRNQTGFERDQVSNI